MESTAIEPAPMAPSKSSAAGTRFHLSFPASVHSAAITGRIFLILTRNDKTEPRMQMLDAAVFGADVKELRPETPVILDDTTPGCPVLSLREVPAGEYFVQALLNVYTEFHRADGHIIWAHMDRWEGQEMARAPGNLVSEVRKLHIDPQAAETIQLELNSLIPPIEIPADTEWVKRIRFESKLLSEFWGRPMRIGATILLPRGYQEHPDVRYPVIYVQGHFSLDAPFGFTTEPDPPGTKSWARQRERWAAKGLNMPEPPADTPFNGSQYNVESGYEFFQSWNSDNFPRVIAVTFQHPTPYFDNSYGVNSANTGPYGDAILHELIPRIEEQFRVSRQPYSRVLTGCSTGGWASLALQLYHPEFFSGAWVFCPDPVDFRRYYAGVNIYEDANAFLMDTGPGWTMPERFCFRSGTGQGRFTNRQFSRLTAVLGTQDAGYQWASFTPVGLDGYPRPVWDLMSGAIDREVAAYMKAHDYDLRDYLERNWPHIGPCLVNKLHFYGGDEDGGFFNLALYLLEDFLANTQQPPYEGSFIYGRPLKDHGWQPMTNAELVKTMADHIARHAPATENRTD